MSVINVLDKSVAELIAAGEVVERPASIVKELIENAIDAGASGITVEIQNGGVRLIRISDDGCGISRKDAPKAFLRHATSKICKADDLDGILTLGFRGEALASIAAMCRVELMTKTKTENEGTALTIEGGEVLSCEPAPRPTGTTITVRDVFFNTPARMKFLKKDIPEGNSVAQVVDKCALSHPEISFKLIRDGAVKLKTSGNGDLLAVIYEIYGREFASEMLEIDYVYEQFAHVTGYISKPDYVKPSRSYQTFFINNRFVKTRTAAAALEEAYKNKIMGGKFPACFLNIELDAASVDVNVHPAKIEVRFANEKPVFQSVYYAVKSALASLETPLGAAVQKDAAKGAPVPEAVPKESPYSRMSARAFQESFAEKSASESDTGTQFTFRTLEPAGRLLSRPISMRSSKIDIDISVDDLDTIETKKTGDSTGFDKIIPEQSVKIFYEDAINEEYIGTITVEQDMTADFKVIGEIFGTYILLEQNHELVLIDKHAAHERILYEQLKRELCYGNRQVLLAPQSVALSRDEHAAVMENTAEVEKLGFFVEDFGGNAVIVREVPIELSENDVAFTIREIAGKLANGSNDLTPNVLDRLYYNIACRAAIKAHDKNSAAELEEIVKRLRDNPAITHCPHGRPVFVRLNRHDIEKMFGRLG